MTNIIKLPQPQKDLKFPLMKALEMRRTKRKWKDSNLSYQEISNLLWAACGINYEETKKVKAEEQLLLHVIHKKLKYMLQYIKDFSFTMKKIINLLKFFRKILEKILVLKK